MRSIRKWGNYGYFLEQANTNPPQTPQQATSRWGSFAHKRQLLEFLLSEQYSLCCYSEIRADELSIGYHIEHIENKRINPSRTFDSSNIAASALSDTKIINLTQNNLFQPEAQSIFGGHAPGKQSSVDMSRFVTPHQGDCSRFFTYVSDGRIVPSYELDGTDTERARYTIDLLNLNSPFLVALRRKWWDELDELFVQHENENSEILYLAQICLVPCNGHLYRFFSLTRNFFGDISEDILRNHAPELV